MAIVLATTALVACGSMQAREPREYSVYFLGGQSNMDGYGVVSELPQEMNAPVRNTYIFTGSTMPDNETGGGVGLWEQLQPGFGLGFKTDGQVNQRTWRFGPELNFGRTLVSLDRKRRVAIIKYSMGGTALAVGAGYGNWHPDYAVGNGINQYDHALATIRNALSHTDIDGDRRDDVLVPAGIIWMQGEADAFHSPETARDYRENLERMMNLLRDALGDPGLPVVIGKITDSGMSDDGTVMDYIDTVQKAQKSFVADDECAALVTDTDTYGYIYDGWHYDSDGYVQMGAAFARAAIELARTCGRRKP